MANEVSLIVKAEFGSDISLKNPCLRQWPMLSLDAQEYVVLVREYWHINWLLKRRCVLMAEMKVSSEKGISSQLSLSKIHLNNTLQFFNPQSSLLIQIH